MLTVTEGVLVSFASTGFLRALVVHEGFLYEGPNEEFLSRILGNPKP